MILQPQRERERRHTSGPIAQAACIPYQAFMGRFPDGSWAGRRCFIIGGGPSLKGFDFERLRGERVIAINKAFYDVPFADIVFGMDRPFLDDIMCGKFGGKIINRHLSRSGVRSYGSTSPAIHTRRAFIRSRRPVRSAGQRVLRKGFITVKTPATGL